MKLSLSSNAPHRVKTACLVIGVAEDAPLDGAAAEVDRASDGMLSAMISTGDIDANRGNTTLLHRVPGVAAERVLVVGCGKPEKFDRVRFDRACQDAGAFLREHAVTEAHVYMHDMPVEDLDEHWKTRQAAIAFDRANYLYTATKAPRDDSPMPLRAAVFQGGAAMQPALDQAIAIAAGYRRARELGNLPANICNPAYLAQQASSIAEHYANTAVEILKKDAMAELGMDALLGVAQGSENGPRLIILRYQGAERDERPYVFIGKGITFDSGGISLKPGPNMDQMKFDMCGAATVLGAFEACAAMQLPVNLVTVVAAAENMPDGKSYRPGDVLTSMSGKTIEILNTDAEGRLPIWEDYQTQLKTPFADLKNVGGMPAGAITAGCFLASFAKKQRWAHLDIAGSAWKWGEAEGATGRPVGLLTQFLIDRAG